ncbi:olfactory receptor 6M1-like [Alligator mississippiensis]|uniref:olfactory receptor 6M1-like n=1 Tax=Alligator mississippiensis TaxID=8496 RepID=UPI00287764C1|nr:olfactory receptor 6M1-like [Alligator mississippiensis]
MVRDGKIRTAYVFLSNEVLPCTTFVSVKLIPEREYAVAMKPHNRSSVVTEFVLLSFPMPWPWDILFFVLLLAIFTLTLTGNLLIISLVFKDRQLRTPMYFFLCNLSILEILFIFSVIPKLMENLLSLDKTITFWGCITQCYFYFFLGIAEFFLIAVMSLDRYVAICHPLHYPLIMNKRVCALLVMGCWLGGCLFPLSSIILLSRLPFCGPNIIDHFFCDYAPLVRLSCIDTNLLLTIESVLAAVVQASSLAFTLGSYAYIISTILRIRSSTGRQKAFSTCASHITVASIFYGSAIFMYCLPSQGRSPDVQKAVGMLSVVVTPPLNPFIYSLRNEKVKNAMRDFVRGKKISL